MAIIHDPYAPPAAEVGGQDDRFYQPKVFSFSGRIGRLRYLAYSTGANLLFGVLMVPVAALTNLTGADGETANQAAGVMGGGLFAVGYFIMLAIFIAFAKRRLNDMNRSGWWILAAFIPLANLILFLFLIFGSGTDGENDYGPAPAANTLGVKILGLLFPVLFFLGIVAAIAIPSYVEYANRAAGM